MPELSIEDKQATYILGGLALFLIHSVREGECDRGSALTALVGVCASIGVLLQNQSSTVLPGLYSAAGVDELLEHKVRELIEEARRIAGA